MKKTLCRLQKSWTWQTKGKFLHILSIASNTVYSTKTSLVEKFCICLSLLQEGVEEKDEKKIIEKLCKESNLEKKETMRFFSFLKKKEIVLMEALDIQVEDTLYNRQERFFSLFESNQFTWNDLNLKLQNRKVLILGLGAYGSVLTILCARMGIKHIVGIDFDHVELSNLSRQTLYSQKDIGKAKTRACAEYLKEINPYITFEEAFKHVKKPEDLYPYLEGADFMFCPGSYHAKDTDRDLSAIINLACIEKQVACLTFGGNWMGPIYDPGKSACYFCAKKKLFPKKLQEKKSTYTIEKAVGIPPFAPLHEHRLSGLVWEMSCFFTGLPFGTIYGKVVQLDPWYIREYKEVKVPIDPDCICMQKYREIQAEKKEKSELVSV